MDSFLMKKFLKKKIKMKKDKILKEKARNTEEKIKRALHIIKIKKDKNISQVVNDEYIQEEENDSDIEIIDINYKKKDILIYNEIQSKNLSLKLKNDKKENKIDP